MAQALAALIVGLPLWLIHWRIAQREARQEGEPGEQARRSPVRRSYLYAALFAGVLGAMVGAGVLLYEMLRAAWGDASPDFAAQIARSARVLLVFGTLFLGHWLALRSNEKKAGRLLARRHAQFPVLILSPGEGEQAADHPFARALVSALQRQAPALPVAVHPQAAGAPDESLSAARAVILPSELLAHPSEGLRLWLQGFNGARLVIPTQTTGWHWITGGGRPLAWLARQVAANVRRLAEGEEIPPATVASPWMILVYILAGLFVLQILAGLAGLAATWLIP